MTKEEAQRAIDEFNRKMKPIEDAFMCYVHAYKAVGYGRMIQLINEHWNQELEKQRNVYMSESGGKGSTLRVP